MKNAYELAETILESRLLVFTAWLFLLNSEGLTDSWKVVKQGMESGSWYDTGGGI